MDKLKLISVGSWHGNFKFDNFIEINEIPTGCGINYIKGISNLHIKNCDELLEALKIIADDILLNEKYKYPSKILRPCGTFICTLGNNYQKNYEPYLLRIGFKEIADYQNKAHPRTNDTQKLYILHL